MVWGCYVEQGRKPFWLPQIYMSKSLCSSVLYSIQAKCQIVHYIRWAKVHCSLFGIPQISLTFPHPLSSTASPIFFPYLVSKTSEKFYINIFNSLRRYWRKHSYPSTFLCVIFLWKEGFETQRGLSESICIFWISALNFVQPVQLAALGLYVYTARYF